MFCTLVPHEGLNAVWLQMIDLVRKFVPEAHGRATEMSIYRELVMKETQLWVAFDDEKKIVAFVVTRINTYPTKRMLGYEYIGADDHRLGDWFDEMHDLTARFAKDNNCQGVESVGRIGWTKVLRRKGWHPAFVIYEQNFNEEPVEEPVLEEEALSHG